MAENKRQTPSIERIAAKHAWDELVLPANQNRLLHEICDCIKQSRKTSELFGSVKAAAKGLPVLFSGASGTRKILAAQIIANALQLELYRIDLSMVVSKFIGETEKNLNAIFDNAKKANAVLFFDEADALFGKRSEVKDSHDRYGNIEVNYLLERIEEYSGLVIIATNSTKNLDASFLRRLRFIVDFPCPDTETIRSTIKKPKA